MCKCVEGEWVTAEIGNVKNSLCEGQIELGEICIKASVW